MSGGAVKERVLEQVRRQFDEQVDLLARLVRFPSTQGQTNLIQEFLAEYLKRSLNLDVRLEPIDKAALQHAPGFSPVEWSYSGLVNCVSIVPGTDGDHRSLILNGHVDVVPPGLAQHWSHDPWGGMVDGGRLYGRGAADMKGGLAAIIFAVAAVRSSGLDLRGDVVIHSVIDEEASGNGTASLLHQGYRGSAAIVPEPLGPGVVVAHPGVLWVRLSVQGRAAHAQSTSSGVNAIDKAMFLIGGLRELESEWNSPRYLPPEYLEIDHPINFNMGVIRGGEWPSTVPDSCIIEVRIGVPPTLSLELAKRAVESRIQERATQDPWLRASPPDVAWFGIQAEPTDYRVDHQLYALLAANHHSVTGERLVNTVVTATMDSRFFDLYGIPALTYGPIGGNIHSADEWIDLASLRSYTAVLAGLLVDWCEVSS